MNKTVLITGSSQGIGKETVKLFQSQGWHVAATMRNLKDSNELKSLKNVKVYQLDVLDFNSITKAIDEAIQDFGNIDVVINNAGCFLNIPIEIVRKEEIQHHFGVNILGMIDVTRAILPHFRENNSGVLVNLSSAASITGFPCNSLYNATKFAVEGFSEGLAFEAELYNIKVRTICPGGHATQFSEGPNISEERENPYIAVQEKYLASTRKRKDTGSYGDPKNVANAIYTAATDETSGFKRYFVGKDAKQLNLMRRLLGYRNSHRMIKKSMNL